MLVSYTEVLGLVTGCSPQTSPKTSAQEGREIYEDLKLHLGAAIKITTCSNMRNGAWVCFRDTSLV